jgi:putative transposase
MINKFKNKYRIPSARWRGWNYTDEGAYFITICTKNRSHFFGNVIDGEMHYSEIGKIAEQEWLKSPTLRPDMNLDMEIFQIMPNHIHGIIVIGQNEYNSNKNDAMDDANCRDVMNDVLNIVETNNIRDAKHGVSTRDAMNPYMIEHNPPANHFGPQSKNLASILRGFKSAVTIEARTIQSDFCWQERFHDHVIRDDDEFRRIANYIFQNPANWGKDIYNELR